MRHQRLVGLVVLCVLIAGCSAAGTAEPPARPASPATSVSPAEPTSSPVDAPLTTPAPVKPNIVVVMADDMRVDDLRYAPQVRRLARSGVSFDNSFSPFPLCCPARASFLTGQHAHNHRVLDVKAPYGYRAFDDSRTLATSLRAAGYLTGFVGKYLNGYGPDRSRVSGLPSYRYVPRGWTDWAASFENPGVPGITGGTYHYFDTPYNVNGRVDQRYRGRYQTGVIGDFSLRLTSRYAARDKPFFLYVNYVAPHTGGPIEADDPPLRLVGRGGIPWEVMTPARPDWVKGRFDSVIRRPPGLALPGAPPESTRTNKENQGAQLRPMTPALVRAVTESARQRAESVFAMDRQVGRLVARLKQTGEWSRTYLVFTSDNGFFLGEHHRPLGKIWGHEPSLRVPLIVTGPGVRTGTRRYDPITLVDLAATIVDLADARPPRRPDGVSRVTTLRSGDQGWTTPVLYEALIATIGSRPRVSGWPKRGVTAVGVRTARYSYLQYATGKAELYDLRRDPQQFTDLTAPGQQTPASRAVRRELAAIWRAFLTCRGAACHRPLPADLQKTPEQTRELSRIYWKGLRRIYG